MSTNNLKRLLIERSQWFDREILAGVRSGPYAFITPGQSRLLAHMGGRPMTMPELARRLSISRQAVHKAVMELGRRGILEAHDDPAGGRVKLVTYTTRGRQLNRDGAKLIDQIEDRLAQRLGRDRVEELRVLLGADWDPPPG